MITAANAPARNRPATAAVLIAAVIVLAAQFALLGARTQLFADFHAFYCGGAAVMHRADPYAQASIAACEATPQPFGLHHTKPGVTAPVPFPGYAFALFAPFSLLPYPLAALLWLLVLVACTVAGGVMLARLAALPLWCALAALGASYPIAVIGLGELAPIALVALCGVAFALRAHKYWLAAIALCVAALLPHVAAPAFLAVLVFVPRARPATGVAIAVLLALDLAVAGPHAAVEYFVSVLPAHAQSEIGYVAQYGLTWMLHAAGVGDRAALLAGNLSYLLMAVAGVLCAGSLARRFCDDALLAAVPAAFAVVGGPFMHYSEMTLALPAMLLLFQRTSGSTRAAMACAAILLAVPWQWIVGEAPLALPVAMAAVFVLVLGLPGGADRAMRASAGAVGYGAVLLVVALHFGPQVQHLHGAAVDPHLAQSSWTAYIRTQGASAGPVWWLAKAPTWLGVLLLAAGCAYVAAHEDLKAPVVIERAPARL